MDKTLTVAELLQEAAEAHHVVYRIVDGDDPDWASWYADWLLTLSEFPQLLGQAPGPQPPRARARPTRPGIHVGAAERTVGGRLRPRAPRGVRDSVK